MKILFMYPLYIYITRKKYSIRGRRYLSVNIGTKEQIQFDMIIKYIFDLKVA